MEDDDDDGIEIEFESSPAPISYDDLPENVRVQIETQIGGGGGEDRTEALKTHARQLLALQPRDVQARIAWFERQLAEHLNFDDDTISSMRAAAFARATGGFGPIAFYARLYEYFIAPAVTAPATHGAGAIGLYGPLLLPVDAYLSITWQTLLQDTVDPVLLRRQPEDVGAFFDALSAYEVAAVRHDTKLKSKYPLLSAMFDQVCKLAFENTQVQPPTEDRDNPTDILTEASVYDRVKAAYKAHCRQLFPEFVNFVARDLPAYVLSDDAYQGGVRYGAAIATTDGYAVVYGRTEASFLFKLHYVMSIVKPYGKYVNVRKRVRPALQRMAEWVTASIGLVTATDVMRPVPEARLELRNRATEYLRGQSDLSAWRIFAAACAALVQSVCPGLKETLLGLRFGSGRDTEAPVIMHTTY
jgi:hypothetical protein